MKSRLARQTAKWLLTCLLASTLVGCGYHGPPNDIVDQLAGRYGVHRETILEVMDELNVSLEEVEKLGSCPFPCNYYERQFDIFKQEHGRYPYRSEVEQIIAGYVAKCNADYAGMIQYVYYSQTGWEGLVLEIAFESPRADEPAPEDPLFSHIQIVELQDRSVNPRSETYWGDCIQEYSLEQGVSE